MKKAIHFGAGNIGRGFIGQLLAASNYEITFVDVAAALVDDINELGQYNIEIVGDNPERILVKNIKAINSDKNPEELFAAISTADIITTAIGPNILKFIAPNIAKGLTERLKNNTAPLNIIACENMIGGSTVLKNFVYEALSPETKELADKYIGFPDAAVDRIVPLQKNDEKLLVKVEPYCEWDVDATKVVGEKPDIKGLTYVDNLSAYIERKLFTVNTGHAAIAYLAYQKGIKDISSALKDEEILHSVRKVWAETGALLVDKYGFSKDKHEEYVRTTEGRFKNPHLSDEVTRVARGPKRKLSAKDRLLAPATELLARGLSCDTLVKVIVAAFKFDFDGDAEAKEVQGYIKENGIEKAVLHFTEAKQDGELFKKIIAAYK